MDKIEEYMKSGEPIIFLEYEGHGRTLDRILDLVQDYEFAHVLKKGIDDGSYRIISLFDDLYKTEEIEEFEFCGVNLEACVWRTVAGLSLKLPAIPIKIIHNCCDSSNGKTYATNFVLNPKRSKNNVALVGCTAEFTDKIESEDWW